MLSDAEKQGLVYSRQFVERIFAEIPQLSCPEMDTILDKFDQVNKIKSYALSKTISVVVGNCARVSEGAALAEKFDEWVHLAQNDIAVGYGIIEQGFMGNSFEKINGSTVRKMIELESEYAAMTDEQLRKKCYEYEGLLDVYISEYG